MPEFHQDAIQSMKLNNIRRLPVVNREGKMVGIIADKDIFRAIINNQSLVASISENVVNRIQTNARGSANLY